MSLQKLAINEISRIGVIVGGDDSQGAVWFPMKILFIMKCGKTNIRISNVTFILCKKDISLILESKIIEQVQ